MKFSQLLAQDSRRALLWDYVSKKHKQQKRKYTNEPYTVHLQGVAERACMYETNPLTFEVAICHDLIEDTTVTTKLLLQKLIAIGYSKADAVIIMSAANDLTDFYTPERFPALNRAERKICEAARLGTIAPWVQSIKYADLLDNCSTIVDRDKGFARLYIKEKRMILDAARKGNIDLFMECCYIIIDAETKLFLWERRNSKK